MPASRAYDTFTTMLRAALTAFVLASVAAAVACGSGTSSGPAVVAGAAAGDVVEVSGTVTATRAGTPRPIAAGDVISGDDVIETGADGRVTITLRHNRVAWTLGPGKKEQVGASLAWRAPTASQTAAGPTGERSGAAGRHAEREAADTAATANMEVAAAAPPAPAAAATPPPVSAPEAPAMADRPARAEVTRGGRADDQVAAAAAAEERELMARQQAEEAQRAMVEGELRAKREAESSQKMRSAERAPADEKRSADEAPGGLGLTGGAGAGGGGGGGAGIGAVAKRTAPGSVRTTVASGPLAPEVVRRIVLVNRGRLLACIKAPGAVVASARLTIGADGKVSGATVAGVPDDVAKCQTAVYQKLTFPTAAGTTTASVRLETN